MLHISHTLRFCSNSIHPLSACSVLVPVTLRHPSWKAQSALTGLLSQAWAGTTNHVSASALLRPRGTAPGSEDNFSRNWRFRLFHSIYICVCVCVCVCIYIYIYIKDLLSYQKIQWILTLYHIGCLTLCLNSVRFIFFLLLESHKSISPGMLLDICNRLCLGSTWRHTAAQIKLPIAKTLSEFSERMAAQTKPAG